MWTAALVRTENAADHANAPETLGCLNTSCVCPDSMVTPIVVLTRATAEVESHVFFSFSRPLRAP